MRKTAPIICLIMILLFTACDDSTTPTENPVVLSGDLLGLGDGVNSVNNMEGRMYFDNDRTNFVIISGGHWSIEASHNIYEGSRDVDIELTSGGYDHVNIKAYLTGSALTFGSTGDGLKVAEKNNPNVVLSLEEYDTFIGGSGSTKHAGNLTGIYIITDQLYDSSSGSFVEVDEPFEINSTTKTNLENVLTNDLAPYSNGVVNNVPIYRSDEWDVETQGAKPTPERKDGWIIVVPDNRLISDNASLVEASYTNDDGEIVGGMLGYNPVLAIQRNGISVDVGQMLNNWAQAASGLTTDGNGRPSVKARMAAKYGRQLPVGTNVTYDANNQPQLDGVNSR